jgi:alpha-beta hydrolase superfamily lysophospholipase
MRNEESTIEANGHTLFTRRWLPDRAAKAVVVVLHGFAEHSGRYEYVGRWLAERGYAVEALDLRGHGKSSGRRAFVRSFDEYFDDLLALLRDVERRHAGTPIFMLGHSMGGSIVAQYVIREQPDWDGVVLSGPALRGRRNVPRPLGWLFRLIGRFVPRLRLAKLAAGDVSRDPDVVARYDSDPLVYRRGIPAGTLLAMVTSGAETNAGLERFALPLLIVHGSEDALTDPDGSRALYKRASTGDKQLNIYPGLFHEVMNEPEKDRVLHDILTWLDALVAPKAQSPSPAAEAEAKAVGTEL